MIDILKDQDNMPENYAFTDGSYNTATHTYGFGGFLVCKKDRIVLQGAGSDPEFAVSRNVAGEVMGAMEAVAQAAKHGVSDLVLYYDYTGIENWATGKWKTNKRLTREYAAFMREASSSVRVRFVHVKAHSGIPGNEEADMLAKEAVGLIEAADQSGVVEIEAAAQSGNGADENEVGGSENRQPACGLFVDLKEHFAGRSMQRIKRGDMRDAAVLIPVVEREGSLYILFEVRKKGIAQGGEICFPGGRIEEGETPRKTAVRETAEELLVDTEQIGLIAPLFELPGPGGCSVYAYLGRVENYKGTFQSSEVERIFLLPIDELRGVEHTEYEGVMKTLPGEDFPYDKIPGGRDYPFSSIKRSFFFYDTPEGVIWGLTGEILYYFLREIA